MSHSSHAALSLISLPRSVLSDERAALKLPCEWDIMQSLEMLVREERVSAAVTYSLGATCYDYDFTAEVGDILQ